VQQVIVQTIELQSFTAPLEQTLDDMKTMANAVKDMSDRIDLRVRKSLQPTDKAKKKISKKSKGISKPKPFLSDNPPQPSVSNATQQATSNNAVGSQSFTRKDISDIRNDYLQKQSELQPIKPQSPF
jgi:ABC-type Fe3+-citrate transport system substrate-binding protein